MLGIIIASDKTPLTVGTGNKEMHPLLISLANIDAGVRMKATSHSFVVAGYLPIPKFQDVSREVQSILDARCFHICLDIVFRRLKEAELRDGPQSGVPLCDPNGQIRQCHTPLVSAIADLPEQRLLSCVASNQSPRSLAVQHQFGDGIKYASRTRDHTIDLIAQACATADPRLVSGFHKACHSLGLSGVIHPFWRDWGTACPSTFLTPDALHGWHKFYFDHLIKWVINIAGADEVDRRLKALQPRVGVRHWRNGVSKLKQLTGREHRELERVLVVIAAGAVPQQVLQSLRAMTEFIFIAQTLFFWPEHIFALESALEEFHHYKNAIILAGGRRGKHGPIPHFNIPKLEMMQGVADSIRHMGAPYQYTSDTTERCHITCAHTPYAVTNKQDFHPQCCRYMDRQEKVRRFSLYTRLKHSNASLVNEMVREASALSSHYPEAIWLATVAPGEVSAGNKRLLRPTLFDKTRSHVSDDQANTFSVTIRPHYPSLSVQEASGLACLPDLHAALGDYFEGLTYASRRGIRRSTNATILPFQNIRVWTNFRLQQRSAQDNRIILPSRTVQALLPSVEMPHGRCNTVLVDGKDGFGEQTSVGGDIESRSQPF